MGDYIADSSTSLRKQETKEYFTFFAAKHGEKFPFCSPGKAPEFKMGLKTSCKFNLGEEMRDGESGFEPFIFPKP